MITGDNVFSKLKYESGAHRVQRVPSTESQGRVHTSTATVVVMPEAEEVEIELEDKDIRVDIYHASGAGGQHVNKTASAVRLTHLPTGIVVAMQDERSQLKKQRESDEKYYVLVYTIKSLKKLNQNMMLIENLPLVLGIVQNVFVHTISLKTV